MDESDSCGFDLLGTVDTGLSHQFITLRIKSLDTEKLKQKLGGSTGGLAAAAMPLVDLAPQGILSMATPYVIKAAKDYGVDLEMNISNAPTKGTKVSSELLPGLAIGVVLGVTSLGIVKLLLKTFSAIQNRGA
jgi:hypothetical protein